MNGPSEELKQRVRENNIINIIIRYRNSSFWVVNLGSKTR